MRVVAGELRGRRLVAPSGDATRPTTDKVREAVFNSLASMGVVDGAEVLDLFAGSGAMGIEAISRGAAHCTFVERDRTALAALRSNLATLGVEDRTSVVAADACSWSGRAHWFDLVIADPPYTFDGWDALIRSLSAGYVVCEAAQEVSPPAGWESLRVRRYGRTTVTVLGRIDDPDPG